MTAEERQRLERGYQLASEAAQVIRELKTSASAFRGEFEQLRDALKKDLDNAVGELPKLISGDLIPKLKRALLLIKDAAPKEYEEVVAAVAVARAHLATLAAFKEAIEQLRKVWPAGMPAKRFSSSASRVQAGEFCPGLPAGTGRPTPRRRRLGNTRQGAGHG